MFSHSGPRSRPLRVAAVALAAGTLAAVVPATSASAATTTPTISSTATSFVTTNGDILAERVMTVNGVRALAIGGSFSRLNLPNGTTKAAANFAVIQESNSSVLYAASSTSSAGYVRALTFANNVVYLGGDFTSINGTSRSHIAALSTTSWTLTNWAPSIGSPVRALTATATMVYAAGESSSVYGYNQGSTATLVWSKPVSGGMVKVLLTDGTSGGVFVGGYFDSIGGFTNHGLIELNAADGSPMTSFAPYFLPNNQPGNDPSYNGENPFALSLVDNDQYLAVSSGGINNWIRLLTTSTGSRVWGYSTPGDAQAATTVGTSVVGGFHRWRTNTTTKFPYFAAQFSEAGALQSWNPQLSGTQTLADQGGNGTMALTYDGVSKMLFVGGAFTTYGATCNPNTTVTCTGGTAKQSLAAYATS